MEPFCLPEDEFLVQAAYFNKLLLGLVRSASLSLMWLPWGTREQITRDKKEATKINPPQEPASEGGLDNGAHDCRRNYS